jgi:hypothetical protein
MFSFARARYLHGMSRNWTSRDALIDVLMEHLYVWAPGETEARRIIESMADQMLQTMDEAGYAFVMVEPKGAGSRAAADPSEGRAH